jgi:hypothetical protein
MNTDFSNKNKIKTSLGQSPNNIMNSKEEKSPDPETVVCAVCTFAYQMDESTCDLCLTPNPLVMTRDEEMAKAMAVEMIGDQCLESPSYYEDEELASALAALELQELQEHKDSENKNFEQSMPLVHQLAGDHPHPGLSHISCSICSSDNSSDRVQCIVCHAELDNKERALAPGVVSRELIEIGPSVYDEGGKPDMNILGPLGFVGKRGSACLVNAIAYVVKNTQLLPKDLTTLASRVTKDCKDNPDGPMWSDLLGVWFQ